MKATSLGEFEEIVLLTVGTLHGDAYGVQVRRELEERLERKVNISAVHSALYRLESKGFLSTHMGEATNKRGGKRKKYFEVTAFGMQALKDARNLRTSLWNALPRILLEGGEL